MSCTACQLCAHKRRKKREVGRGRDLLKGGGKGEEVACLLVYIHTARACAARVCGKGRRKEAKANKGK